ncbi:MAG: trehalose-6-phosphate synthase [Sandaracinus sp.]
MRRAARFVVVLVVGLAVLTWGAYVLVDRATRSWFETDTMLRAELVARGAGEPLILRTDRGDTAGVASILTRITRDERILGTALCGEEPQPRAETAEYPSTLDCTEVRRRGETAGGAWFFSTDEPGGRVHVSAIPLDGGPLVLVLVHDLSFVERREHDVQRVMLVVFAVLALAASLVTLLAQRLAWRSWTDQLRRVLRGEEAEKRREFQPLLRDVRELAERLAAELEPEQGGNRWTPERLKGVLTRALEGDRIILVANREPYIHEKSADGAIRVVHPASGLVTALEPVMRACSGTWVAHGSGTADRETADAQGHVRVPPGEESYVLRRVWLGPEEERGYYYGFSNEGLWPLCHVAHARPTFRETDWQHYREVNQRFADAVCDEADSEDPIVLVQDYHFALVPRMIRKRLPRATILTFWHIPWPNAERFGICPWREELLDGLLGSSILGFHTQQHCNQFLDGVDAFVESRIDREKHAVVQGGHTTLVRPYPISLEWPSRWMRDLPPAAACRAEIFRELGLPENALLGVGIDRLDYTKGIEERLLAVERLLERRPDLVGRFVFAQLAAPSRTQIPRYRDLDQAVEATSARINERFGRGDYRPIALLRAHHEPPTVYRYYRAADVCYVSSLHDGMNLVAKEFVAARDDERGALVLSQFTGAARELTEALIVNPYDLEEASAAMAAALDMTPSEQTVRMRSMRAVVAELNVYRWAGRMLVDAASLRRKERLSGRLTSDWASSRGPVTT